MCEEPCGLDHGHGGKFRDQVGMTLPSSGNVGFALQRAVVLAGCLIPDVISTASSLQDPRPSTFEVMAVAATSL